MCPLWQTWKHMGYQVRLQRIEKFLDSMNWLVWGPESEPKPGTISISTGTKFVPLRRLSSKFMKTPPQNLQKREIAVVSDLNVFEYLQNSEGSDDMIKKHLTWKNSLCEWAQMSTDNNEFCPQSRDSNDVQYKTSDFVQYKTSDFGLVASSLVWVLFGVNPPPRARSESQHQLNVTNSTRHLNVTNSMSLLGRDLSHSQWLATKTKHTCQWRTWGNSHEKNMYKYEQNDGGAIFFALPAPVGGDTDWLKIKF